MNRQCSESESQAAENGGERGRTSDNDAAVLLQHLNEARLPQHFGVKTLGGQEENREIGRPRRIQVLVPYVFASLTHDTPKRIGSSLHTIQFPSLRGVEKAQVVLLWKLGVDW